MFVHFTLSKFTFKKGIKQKVSFLRHYLTPDKTFYIYHLETQLCCP